MTQSGPDARLPDPERLSFSEVTQNFVAAVHKGQKFSYSDGDYVTHPQAVAEIFSESQPYKRELGRSHDTQERVVELYKERKKEFFKALKKYKTANRDDLVKAVFIRENEPEIFTNMAAFFKKHGVSSETVTAQEERKVIAYARRETAKYYKKNGYTLAHEVEPGLTLRTMRDDVTALTRPEERPLSDTAKPRFMKYLEQMDKYHEYVEKYRNDSKLLRKFFVYMRDMELLADHAARTGRTAVLEVKEIDLKHNSAPYRNPMFFQGEKMLKKTTTEAKILRYEIASQYLAMRKEEIAQQREHAIHLVTDAVGALLKSPPSSVVVVAARAAFG